MSPLKKVIFNRQDAKSAKIFNMGMNNLDKNKRFFEESLAPP
jgi:hypothetical protein